MSNPKSIFSIYRYQLVPLTENIQAKLFDVKFETIEELRNKKNEFFEEVLLDPRTRFISRYYEVLSKIDFHEKNITVLKIGVQKNKEIHSSDFETISISDYPNVFVYIDNDKEKQLIIIENNYDAFTDTTTVSNIIKDSLYPILERYNLALYIEQTFDENEFWDTIREYQDRIISLRFEFIKPNLANISARAVERIRELKNNINSHRTTLNFHAPQGGILERLNRDNEEITDLVSYSKEGGGTPPTIQVKGISHIIKTTKTERKIEIEQFKGSAEDLIKIFQTLNDKLG